jgi:hypothetical protein
MAFLNSGKSHLAYVPAFTLLNPKAWELSSESLSQIILFLCKNPPIVLHSLELAPYFFSTFSGAIFSLSHSDSVKLSTLAIPRRYQAQCSHLMALPGVSSMIFSRHLHDYLSNLFLIFI